MLIWVFASVGGEMEGEGVEGGVGIYHMGILWQASLYNTGFIRREEAGNICFFVCFIDTDDKGKSQTRKTELVFSIQLFVFVETSVRWLCFFVFLLKLLRYWLRAFCDCSHLAVTSDKSVCWVTSCKCILYQKKIKNDQGNECINHDGKGGKKAKAGFPSFHLRKYCISYIHTYGLFCAPPLKACLGRDGWEVWPIVWLPAKKVLGLNPDVHSVSLLGPTCSLMTRI